MNNVYQEYLHEDKNALGLSQYQRVRHIVIEGDVSDDSRQKMWEITNKCPNHRLMSGEISSQSALA